MTEDKKLVTLFGGPLDGHQLEVKDSATEVIPMKHHFQQHEMTYRPLKYRLNHSGRFIFVEYLILGKKK